MTVNLAQHEETSRQIVFLRELPPLRQATNMLQLILLEAITFAEHRTVAGLYDSLLTQEASTIPENIPKRLSIFDSKNRSFLCNPPINCDMPLENFLDKIFFHEKLHQWIKSSDENDPSAASEWNHRSYWWKNGDVWHSYRSFILTGDLSLRENAAVRASAPKKKRIADLVHLTSKLPYLPALRED